MRQEANFDRYMRGERYAPISAKIPVVKSAYVTDASAAVGATREPHVFSGFALKVPRDSTNTNYSWSVYRKVPGYPCTPTEPRSCDIGRIGTVPFVNDKFSISA